MTLETSPKSGPLRGGHAVLLVVALMLLIVGFPSLLFGLFLALSPGQNGLGGDVAFGLGAGGFVGVLCALMARAYLRRRDSWF